MRIAAVALLAFACATSEPRDPGAEETDDPTTEDSDDPTLDPTSDTSTAGDDDDDDTDLPTTLPMPQGWNEVDDAPGRVVSASMDLAFGSDGVVYASWVEDRDGEEDIYVSTSADGGVSWAPSVKVDDESTDPLVGTGRQPYLTVTDTGVFLTFTTDAPSVELWQSPLGSLSFTRQPISLANDIVFVDYAKAAEAPDGSVWVAWHSYDASGGFFESARTSNGLAVEAAVAYQGEPCECCRTDVRFNEAGVGMLAFRNNVANVRNQWVLTAQPGDATFTSAVEASSTDWNSNICPMQGPRLNELADSTQLITWADASSGQWMVYLAQSWDGGQSWTADTQILAAEGGDQRSPTIAVDADDTIWLTAELPTGYALATSVDGGANFSIDERLNIDPTNIYEAFAAADHGMAAVAGVSAQGRALMRRLR